MHFDSTCILFRGSSLHLFIFLKTWRAHSEIYIEIILQIKLKMLQIQHCKGIQIFCKSHGNGISKKVVAPGCLFRVKLLNIPHVLNYLFNFRNLNRNKEAKWRMSRSPQSQQLQANMKTVSLAITCASIVLVFVFVYAIFSYFLLYEGYSCLSLRFGRSRSH
jgi:hypothetical protein